MNMTQHNTNVSQKIDNLIAEMQQSASEDKQIRSVDETHFTIKEDAYEVVLNYREGFDLDAFKHRFQEYFEKFDFIVGDWGFEQLRLRGFYQLNKRKVPRDQTIDFLEDYIKEYCNFGCKYFVVAKNGANIKMQQKKIVPPTKHNKKPSEKTIATKSVQYGKPTKVAKPHIELENELVSKATKTTSHNMTVRNIKTVEKAKAESTALTQSTKSMNFTQKKRHTIEKHEEKESSLKAHQSKQKKKTNFVIKQKMK